MTIWVIKEASNVFPHAPWLGPWYLHRIAPEHLEEPDVDRSG